MISASGRSWKVEPTGTPPLPRPSKSISNGPPSASELIRGFDFKQKPLNQKSKVLLNHFEYHNLITNKYNLVVNLYDYCIVNLAEKRSGFVQFYANYIHF
jgi:hypothetical protein